MGHNVFTLIFLAFIFLYGCINLEEPNIFLDFNEVKTFSLSGTVTSLNEVPISNAKIDLISNNTYTKYTNNDGYFEFSNMTPGVYLIKITKEGYRSYNLTFPFTSVGEYTWNFTLVKDCLYYELDTSRDFVVRYGYNGTLQKANLSCNLPYPDNAYLNTSFNEIIKRENYIGQNRMLEVKIDNLKGKYSSIGFYFFLSINGTNQIKIFTRKNTTIEEAARMMPQYLGERSKNESGEIRKMIDPDNEEIKKIATEIREKTGNNVWDVAKELFIWLKNNTVYFNVGGVAEGEYVQSPSELIKSRKGDCDELSYLYISLLRAAGIPARFVEGFLVKENETNFVRHMWVEFYDGEWIPVEVAGHGNPIDEYNTHFGIELNLHVPIFIDDGTQKSFERTGCLYNYYGSKPVISSYTYYRSIPYDSKYLAVCKNERYLTIEKK